MMLTLEKKNRQKGFTMLEIIAVLVIIAIVALVAVSRVTSTRTFDLSAQREVVKTHLRLAQSRAMSASAPYGINFSSTTTYYMFLGSNTTEALKFPGENDATVNLVTKKSSLMITSAPQTILFDAYGSPGTANVTVGTNGGNIDITKNTGFIP